MCLTADIYCLSVMMTLTCPDTPHQDTPQPRWDVWGTRYLCTCYIVVYTVSPHQCPHLITQSHTHTRYMSTHWKEYLLAPPSFHFTKTQSSVMIYPHFSSKQIESCSCLLLGVSFVWFYLLPCPITTEVLFIFYVSAFCFSKYLTNLDHCWFQYLLQIFFEPANQLVWLKR